MKLNLLNRKPAKKTLLLIIITILFLSATQILSSQNETIQPGTISIQTNKAQYQIGETVNVIVNVPDITSYKLYYEYEGFVQRYMGDYRSFSFIPLGIGTHYLVIRDQANNEIIRQSFEVIGAIKTEEGVAMPSEAVHQGILSLINSKRASETAVIKAYDANNNEINLSELGKRAGLNRIERLELVSSKKIFNKIVLRKLLIDSSINLSLGVDEVPLEKVSVPERLVATAFAVDTSELNFTNGTLTRTAEGTELWKCKEWDFENQQCFGTWQKIMNLTPDQDYDLEISPEDPGYAEANITIINVHSYPTVGGNWIVAFNTTGTADLSIRAINGTTWTNYSESSYDLKFLQVNCGNNAQAYEWLNDSVFIANYSCNEASSETSRVLTAGVHNLQFSFGNDVEYAYNNATVAPAISFMPNTPSSGAVTSNASVLINVSIIDSDDLSSLVWNWNGANSTLYDNTLLMLYNFNNNSALGENNTKAVDASLLSVNATIFNASLVTGKYGKAINFTKTNGYVNTSLANSVKGLTQATIAMWIRPTLKGTATQDLYHECIATATDTSRFTFKVTTGGDLLLSAASNESGGLITLVQATANITANQWQHVVGIYDNVSGYHQLYINGKLVANTSTAIGPINSSDPFTWPRIGNHNSGAEPFNGTIDEVMLWNRTLSPEEVKQLYLSNLMRFNSTQWYLFVNESKNGTAALDDGVYTYQAYATDTSSNNNLTEQRNITIDRTAPTVNPLSPANNNFTTINISDYVFNFTDSLSPNASCTLFIGTGRYGTNYSTINNTQTTITANASLADGRYLWNVTCTDWANNSRGSTARNITVDEVAPIVALIRPADANWTTSSKPNFFFNFTDSLSSNASCILYIDDIAEGINISAKNKTQTNITANTSISNGTHTWDVNCTDLAGNVNQSSSRTITVDTVVPIVSAVSPANGSLTNDNISDFTFNYTDNLSPNASCTLYVGTNARGTNASTINNTNTVITDNTSESDGTYRWNVTCIDLAGNKAGSASRNITIDATPPTVNINTTLNNTAMNNSRPTINFNFTDSASNKTNCTLYFNDTAYNTTNNISNRTQTTLTVNTSLADSNYNVYINCTDRALNIGKSGTINITIDTTGPNVTITQPLNFTNITTDTYTLNASAADMTGADTVTFMYRQNQTDSWHFACSDNRDPNYNCDWDLTSLPDGKDYQILAYANDTLGNIGNNDTHTNITIDRTGPNVTITQPLNFTNITTDTYTLNASAADMTGVDTVTFLYRQNASDTWYPICTNDRGPTYDCDWDLTSLPDGKDYQILAYANDTLGNIGNNDTHTNITVDRTAPAITNVINDSINSSSARINWTTDEQANGSVMYGTTLFLTDGTSFDTSLRTQHNITLSGLINSTLYYYNITSCDARGWCNTTGPYNFTTSAQSNNAPTIDSVEPVPDQTPIAEDVNNVPINFTVTDLDGISDLNHSSAKVSVTQGSVTRIGNCSNNTVDSDTVRYNCSVPMQYYDPAGTWAINVSVWDLSGAYTNNTANTFDFNELLYISLSSTVFGFGDFYPGLANQPAASNPLLIDNMGNVNLTQINITAYNLVNGSFNISASNFTVNVSNAPGTHLQNAVSVIIPSANVSVDVNGVDANASLYFFISVPNVPPLNYTSSSDWVITADK